MREVIDLITVGSLIVEITPTQPGETLDTARHYTLVAGGAAANTVFAMARLEVGVRFITAVGDDEFGTLATRELVAFGVDTSRVRRVPGQLTPASFCSVDGLGGKQFRFYRFPGYSSPMEGLREDDFADVEACRLFDFSEGSIREDALRPLVFAAARRARQARVPVLYAMNFRRGAWGRPDDAIRAIERDAVALADIVVLNAEEVSFLTERPWKDGLAVMQAYGPHVVVMTRGGDGSMVVQVGNTRTEIPPYRVPVIYDVGAGDTFHAGLVAAALRGEPRRLTLDEWAVAVRFGAATAAIRVSTSADPRDLPTLGDVEAWMARTN
ncbi:MAG: 2-dehydro-3-deoxygluconokinase [bacterium ADurb.Bin429]|nr:MAG: 2-dehydro-3-deoxygluconokinase [bacterium ADurb.Bin429]